MYVFVGQHLRQQLTRCILGVIPIDELPDDVLLAIFDFCVDRDMAQDLLPRSEPKKKKIEAWWSLVHVCRRWRSLVFGSSRRLNLRLVCTAKTPARDTLDACPVLPLFIRCYGDYPPERVDNIVAVLKHSDRVCQIILKGIPSFYLKNVSAMMQEPFPELTRLRLESLGKMDPVLPDSFLGGSAPRLQSFGLNRISFPGLPKLLLSTTHLVDLHLFDIPHSGYFSPEATVTCLSRLTNLEKLSLGFRSPQSYPDPESRRPPPMTRSVLPLLTTFWFKGVNEFLEDVVAHIDTPQLNSLYIIIFNQVVFDTVQFTQFTSRTPTLNALEIAHFSFGYQAASVKLSSQTPGYGKLNLEIPCRELDWQVSSLEQMCTSSVPPFSTLEDIYIYEDTFWHAHWKDNIEDTLWLELLQPFTAVKSLYLSWAFAPCISLALQDLVEERITEVLPNLENIFLEGMSRRGSIQKGIGQFVAARQVTDHPITLFLWERDLVDWADGF